MPSTNGSATLTEDEAAVRAVPQRIVAAWADNDPEAFAQVFTADGSMILPGDIFVTSREDIREFMTAAFAGPYQGTRVFGEPVAIKILGPASVLLITKGGVLAPEETEVSAERAVRASWLLVKQDGEWLLTAYQNTPLKAA